MLILLTVISIVFLIVAKLFIKDNDKRFDACIFGGIVNFFCVMALLVACGFVVNSYAISDKIAMYKTENAEIDTQICEMVENYEFYEKETFNELVSKQIDVYVKNKDRIMSLQKNLIDLNAAKWWLYFGR